VAEPSARVHAPGGGRKWLTETDPELTVALKALVHPETPSVSRDYCSGAGAWTSGGR
jgi:hypothetical protein